MPRKARIVVPGAFHHIMARGIEGRQLFRDNEDREKFLSFLGQGIITTSFRLYAWALLPNHYHLLIRVSDIPLSDMMRRLNSVYARYFSKKYKRHGYLFQDRYKSIVTQDQHYVEEIIRYVHLNPVRASICRNINDLNRYPWSGHSILMGTKLCEFQETAEVLRRFGVSIHAGRNAYYQFIKEGMDERKVPDTIIEAVRRNNKGEENALSPECWVIGDQKFVKKILENDSERRLRVARYRIEGLTLDDIQKKVAKATGVSAENILRRSRGTIASDARKAFAYVSNKLYGFPVKAIGEYLGISGPPVSISIPQGERFINENKIKINY
jgi:putative transposase